ncbi:MAG: carbamoyltransferase HypF [Methanomassiliicoccales archaeon]
MKIVVRGVVQGVGFRPAVHRIASSLGLNGYVQNNGSNVVIEVDRDVEELLRRLREQLPPLAKLEQVEIVPGKPAEELGPGFRIVPSQAGAKGVGIPNDVAMCDRCREEMLSPSGRRYLYPFTNCTDCGARFSIIEDLPYDREKTSMRAFPMCSQCRREYEDPSDRRFHHQTISCPFCGPSFYLLDWRGRRMEGEPIPTFARLLHQGRIGVCKGWGGMHICCTLETLPRLRLWYRRPEKPFAVMVRDLEAALRYSSPNQEEKEQMLSSHRPIVLVPKRPGPFADLISPGLSNIGIFLPYTEMQNLLFSYLEEDALIMTSANVPGEPMVLRDEDALSLGADCYLMHDRAIINRCDDSVLRVYKGHTFFLRRSRGHIPTSLEMPFKGTALGMGAQEHLAGALAHEGRLYPTQYIGDGSSYGVLEFMESALSYQMRLLDVNKVQAVAVDLHPGYSTRRLGRRLAERFEAEVVEVQHHHAHAAALMLDSSLEELVLLAVDGTGYGTDGVAWGGEVLYSNLDSFERVGHLQEMPLLGGERAVHDIKRLAFALCEMAGLEATMFQEDETELLRKMMSKSPKSTSLGRLLDAISYQLGVCQYRTYDGEPAMKLEPLLERGKESVEIPLVREGDVIKSAEMFRAMVESSGRREDKARSLVRAVLRGLVEIAVEEARERGIRSIGISGGVSYNYTITSMVQEMVERSGFTFVCHDRLPNGDGCIAAGQCAVALNRMR